jgi:hypothetical protein
MDREPIVAGRLPALGGCQATISLSIGVDLPIPEKPTLATARWWPAWRVEKTLAELAAEFGVHPTMISNWKQELVKRATELFARGNKAPAAEDAQKVIDDLHRKIGQLQVEWASRSAWRRAISRSWCLSPPRPRSNIRRRCVRPRGRRALVR